MSRICQTSNNRVNMAAMGRKKTRNADIPYPYFFPRKGKKRTTYYYTRPRPWINLGHDYAQALTQWAEYEGQNRPDLPKPPAANTIGALWRRYRSVKVIQKSPATQKDNEREWRMLEPVFGSAIFEATKRKHVYAYLHGRKGRVRANREIKLLSAMWNFALDIEFTETPNVCIGLNYNNEKPRDRIVEDWEYQAVYNEADWILQDFLDMMLYVGQRNSRALHAKKTDIKTVMHPDTGLPVDALFFERQKGGKRVLVLIEGKFAEAIERMKNRPRNVATVYLIADENGQPLSYWTLTDKFKRARAAAKEKHGVPHFNMQDIRAKTATDDDDEQQAILRLAHTNEQTSKVYIRRVKPVIVKPGRGIK